MARLQIKTEGFENQTLELRPGVNRVGRSPDCDFPIDHPTVSTMHCELILTTDGVILRDCGSTNGSFLNGDPVKEEVRLMAGQTVTLGDVELFVETTQANVVIPQYERPRPKPPASPGFNRSSIVSFGVCASSVTGTASSSIAIALRMVLTPLVCSMRSEEELAVDHQHTP